MNEEGCGKRCMNVYDYPAFFTCGEIIRGKKILCNDCLKLKEKKNEKTKSNSR